MIGVQTFTEQIQIETRTGDAYVDGRYVKGTPVVSSSLRASVQPMKGYEIERLPEGFRSRELLTIYVEIGADVQLLENNAEPIQDSSVIIYNNKRYALLKSFKHVKTKRQAHWKLSVIREAS